MVSARATTDSIRVWNGPTPIGTSTNASTDPSATTR